MNLEFLPPKLVDELKQKQAITDILVQKILYSKRLLVDHVEALEQCLERLNNENVALLNEVANINNNNNRHNSKCIKNALNNTLLSNEIFTTRNTCILLGGSLLLQIFTPRRFRWTLLPSLLISAGFGGFYALKKAFIFRNKLVERSLDNLIGTIDAFGNCIRRNMTYFNEIIIMKQHELIESRQIERAWDCITCAKEVTEILYEATRKLESNYPLSMKFKQYYAPMEELRDCEYFKNNITDYNPKHIKDFHNIFAYVQSQYLLRLALILLTKPSLSTLNGELSKIDCLIRQLVQEEEEHFQNLSYELVEKKQLESYMLNTTKTIQHRSGPIAVLQDSSLKLSARMVAVAGECQGLDITLQRLNEAQMHCKDSTKQLLQVAQNMRTIESALSVSFDDFQRLMLVYNKFLNSRLDQINEQSQQNTPLAANETVDKNELHAEINSVRKPQVDDAQKLDDFYAYMYDESEVQMEQVKKALSDGHDQEREILNFEKRITKGKFKPVLQQLKNRIDPIRKVMLEKEREVLAAKGINVDEFLGETKAEEEENISQENTRDIDSEDSADMEYERRKKELRKIKVDQYEEMRQFLARKEAINLLKLDLPKKFSPAAVGPEEMLESGC